MDDLDRVPARPGSLTPDVSIRMAALRIAIELRDRTFMEWFGLDIGRSLLRQDLVRLVLITFGAGAERPIGHYHALCARLASASTVSQQMRHLAGASAVLIGPHASDRRVTIIQPTQRLVNWACANVKLSNI